MLYFVVIRLCAAAAREESRAREGERRKYFRAKIDELKIQPPPPAPAAALPRRDKGRGCCCCEGEESNVTIVVGDAWGWCTRLVG